MRPLPNIFEILMAINNNAIHRLCLGESEGPLKDPFACKFYLKEWNRVSTVVHIKMIIESLMIVGKRM
jgi:hypothetical protein